MEEIINFFIDAYRQTPTSYIILEAIAFVFGIASVVYAKRENILVYPTGLIATVITVFLLYKGGLMGDMMMNFYYSIMSIYGWWNWSRRKEGAPLIKISRTHSREKLIGIALALLTMAVTYMVYIATGTEVGTSNYIDIITSGIFFTAMWYMAHKKIENWTLWIIGDLITVPLYASRGYGMLSLQYAIFTVLAIQAYIQWKKDLRNQ